MRCPSPRGLLLALIMVVAAAALAVVPAPTAGAAAQIKGTGSTYVALAMQQWVADAQSQGLNVNYLPSGSPTGLSQFAQSLVDFAGTEAEYSALGQSVGVSRGYQYVPDVAGAVAIMYNVQDAAGNKVDYLHLSRKTVAEIFIGKITNWDDPAISADNNGLKLPNEPINIVYRGGQSGTTALFYDFVQHTVPDEFSAWAAKYNLPTQVRIIQLDGTPNFAPKTQAFSGSDQIAQFLASASGLWSIAYDEFGYAVTYNDTTSWVQNQSGQYQLPYAENISAALESAKLRPDLSQDLSDVYTSTNPDAYPISAYSYLVTQCAPTPARDTCKGAYSNSGVADTLSQWMRYIACDGQVQMAAIGYSPLPPNLSQEMANSIGRMTGQAPETLTKDNCANPRFGGSLGAGASAPKDPLQNLAPDALSHGGVVASTGGPGSAGHASTNLAGGSSGTTGGGSTGGTTGGSSATAGGAGQSGSSPVAVGGGSSQTRAAAPVAYHSPLPHSSALPVVLLLLVLVLPLLVIGGGAETIRRMAKDEVGRKGG